MARLSVIFGRDAGGNSLVPRAESPPIQRPNSTRKGQSAVRREISAISASCGAQNAIGVATERENRRMPVLAAATLFTRMNAQANFQGLVRPSVSPTAIGSGCFVHLRYSDKQQYTEHAE